MLAGMALVTDEDRAFGYDDNYKEEVNDAWASNDDEEEEEKCPRKPRSGTRTADSRPAFFLPSDSSEAEQISLFHHDLSPFNMLVTAECCLSGILG